MNVVRNYYSCGCYTSADVPILSRCAEHNGWVVARSGYDISQPRVYKQPRLRICHADAFDVLRKIKPVDFAFVYAQSTWFSYLRVVTPLGFARARMELLERLFKVTDKAVIVVDPEDYGALAYQAELLGLKTYTRLIPAYVRPEPLRHGKQPKIKVYKIACAIGVDSLPRFGMSSLNKLIEHLNLKDDARILDMSCTHLDQIQRAMPNATIIGIIEDAQRFSRSIEPRLDA